MKYTVSEIGYIYKRVTDECEKHTYCQDCKYSNYCPMFDNLTVTIEEEKFQILANDILSER